MGELAREADRDHAPMSDRWQHFTDDEIESIVEALDYHIAATDHTPAAQALYDELVARADQEDDDDG